jgi:hypothetical protein
MIVGSWLCSGYKIGGRERLKEGTCCAIPRSRGGQARLFNDVKWWFNGEGQGQALG